MKHHWLAIGLCLYPAHAWGQAATLADLEGSVVETTVVLQQLIRRDGREFPVRLHNHTKLVIGPGDKFHWTITPISHTPRGIRHGEVRSGTGTLERLRETKTLGGGDAVWFFADGALTNLRTFKEQGAYKRAIAFAIGPQGLTCTANETFMRENGVGQVALNSGIDGVPVAIISAKQVSSTCRVSKKQP